MGLAAHYEPIAALLDELSIGGPRADATRYLRIVVLCNGLLDDPSWTDEVTEPAWRRYVDLEREAVAMMARE